VILVIQIFKIWPALQDLTESALTHFLISLLGVYCLFTFLKSRCIIQLQHTQNQGTFLPKHVLTAWEVKIRTLAESTDVPLLSGMDSAKQEGWKPQGS